MVAQIEEELLEDELQEEVNAALPNKDVTPEGTGKSKIQKPSIKPNTIESSTPVTSIDDLFSVNEDNKPSMEQATNKKDPSQTPTSFNSYQPVSFPSQKTSSKSKDASVRISPNSTLDPDVKFNVKNHENQLKDGGESLNLNIQKSSSPDRYKQTQSESTKPSLTTQSHGQKTKMSPRLKSPHDNDWNPQDAVNTQGLRTRRSPGIESLILNSNNNHQTVESFKDQPSSLIDGDWSVNKQDDLNPIINDDLDDLNDLDDDDDLSIGSLPSLPDESNPLIATSKEKTSPKITSNNGKLFLLCDI